MGIVAESGRQKKMMQTYFEKKDHQSREDKRLRINSDRGVNLHRYTDFKYRNGALHLSKDMLKKYTDDGPSDINKVSDKSKGIGKKKYTYEEIVKRRELNPEFATGKKFKK